MITMLQNWKGTFEINGIQYPSFDAFTASNQALSGEIHIKLYPKQDTRLKSENTKPNPVQDVQDQEVTITVKSYMTKPSSPGFDFMEKWNNNNPMPLRTMVGTKVKETRGMVYMKLHGDILAEVTETCMCCGKPITNPVSKYFGMGPICGNHNYTNPFASDEELKAAVASYRKHLQEMRWEGWIIKSAILEEK